MILWQRIKAWLSNLWHKGNPDYQPAPAPSPVDDVTPEPTPAPVEGPPSMLLKVDLPGQRLEVTVGEWESVPVEARFTLTGERHVDGQQLTFQVQCSKYQILWTDSEMAWVFRSEPDNMLFPDRMLTWPGELWVKDSAGDEWVWQFRIGRAG